MAPRPTVSRRAPPVLLAEADVAPLVAVPEAEPDLVAEPEAEPEPEAEAPDAVVEAAETVAVSTAVVEAT